jgi:hypothetical protein
MIENSTGGAIHHNTIVKLAGTGQCRLSLGTAAGTAIRNNLWFLPATVAAGCQSASCGDNTVLTAPPPFVDLMGGDFRLSQAVPGAALPAPYGMDLRGTQRGHDGVWDQGAFER